MTSGGRKQLLCLSRSYLAHFLPVLGGRLGEVDCHHIVQTDAEAAVVRKLGGTVALNLADVVRRALADGASAPFVEPADMREVTGFHWSAVHADRYLPHFSPERRARIAGALLREVGALFDRQHFDAFLSEPVALFVTHAIFYECRKRGVRPLLWANMYFPNYLYFADAMDITTPVRLAPPMRDEPGRVDALAAAVRAYALGVANDQAGPVYHHAFSGTPSTRLAYFKQRRGASPLVLRPGLSSRLIQIARLARALWARFTLPRGGDYMTAGAVAEHRFYLSCLFASPAIYDELPRESSAANVVFPLQYEPEASLLYFAPHIVSQLSFVETILRALPADKTLWVKEHPNQFGALDAGGWREMKRRYANLRFVHGRQSGRELMKKSGLVVSISSSMGMDGLLLGRRVLVAGAVFYRDFTGAVAVPSYERLAEELNRPSNYAPTDSLESNIGELLRMGQFGYPGDPQPAERLFTEENLDRLACAITAELGASKHVMVAS